jgi:lipopolysaccharide transport system permease protein
MGLTTSGGAKALEQSLKTEKASSGKTEPHNQATLLPDEPLFVIERSKAWTLTNLREFWAARELLYFLTWRDVKVRYKQTFLGVSWVLIQPLMLVLIFTLFFGRLVGLDKLTGGVPYPLFAFAGLLPWMFFSNALTNSSNSLVASANLITKVYFPRTIIPAAAVMAGLVDLGIAGLVFGAMMVYYRVAVSWNLLMLPALIILVALLALGIGMVLSAVNVKFRDVRHALPFIIQVWMFASPVIYPTTIVPERWHWVLALNPISGIIEGFRSALLGRKPMNWRLLAVSAVVTLIVLVYSAFAFKRMEREFADVI